MSKSIDRSTDNNYERNYFEGNPKNRDLNNPKRSNHDLGSKMSQSQKTNDKYSKK